MCPIDGLDLEPKWVRRLWWGLLAMLCVLLPFAVQAKGQSGGNASFAIGAGGNLTLSMNGVQVWSGPCGVTSLDPTKEGAEQWADVLGPTNETSVTASTIYWRKASGKATLRVSREGHDFRLLYTVHNLSALPCRFVGLRMGDSIGAKTGIGPGLMNFNNFQGAANRWRMSWPSEWNHVRLWAWKTPAASYALSIASGMDRVLATAVSEPFVIVEVDIPPGGSKTLSLNLRVQPAAAPLCDVVRRWGTDLAAELGPLLYDPDTRPVVHWIRANRSSATATNPCGFVNWRPDQDPAAARAWAEGIAASAKANGFQGAIAHGGEAGFGLMPWDAAFWGQPIDGADLTPEAWSWYRFCFRQPFETQAMGAGCAVRFGLLAEPLAIKLQRAGTLIYGDERFTEGGEDARTVAARLKAARLKIGRDTQIWTEGHFDLTWPSAGAYVDLGSPRALPFHADLMRIAYPQSGILGNDSLVTDWPEFRAWCEARQLACYVPDWMVAAATPTPVFQPMPKPLQLRASK